MMTVNAYPRVDDGDGLAATANAVLENYKKHGAKVLKTNSVPRKGDRPAEHLIAVVFGRPDFIEAAFARFKLVEGKGFSFVYSHRIYGEKIGDQMSAWLSGNGEAVEKALMEWSSWPSLVRSAKSGFEVSKPGPPGHVAGRFCDSLPIKGSSRPGWIYISCSSGDR
jgi:hypothetical protein